MSAPPPYDPRRYWSARVRGDGALASVGQIALGEYNRFTYPLRLEALDRALVDVPLQGRRIFEAGFGEGVYLAHWRGRGAASVAGLDLSERAVRAGRARFPDFDLRAGDLAAPASFAGFGLYDLVTAIDVLYHVVEDTDWAAALAGLLGLVAPGGAFIWSDKVPAEGSRQVAAHVRRRSLALWRAALARHGFVVVRRVPVFLFMDAPITDGSHPLLGRLARWQWRVATTLIRLSNGHPRLHRRVVAAVARIQRGPERILVRRLRETPNLELLLSRRDTG